MLSLVSFRNGLLAISPVKKMSKLILRDKNRGHSYLVFNRTLSLGSLLYSISYINDPSKCSPRGQPDVFLVLGSKDLNWTV